MLLVVMLVFLIVGVALCLAGEVKLPQGRILRGGPAIGTGVALLSFLPLALLVTALVDNLESGYMTLIYWGLALLCVLAALLVVLRTTQPVAAPRRTSGAGKFLLPDFPAEPEPDNSRGNANKPSQARNPFDFS